MQEAIFYVHKFRKGKILCSVNLRSIKKNMNKIIIHYFDFVEFPELES